MKTVDFIKANERLFDAIVKNHIFPEDIRLLKMYEDSEMMKSNGAKTSYIASLMSRKYSISERHYYSVIKRLGRVIEC